MSANVEDTSTLCEQISAVAKSAEAEEPYTDEDDRFAPMGLLDFDQLLNGDPEPFEWLVPGIFGRGLLYQLVSAPKVGKSLVMLDMARNLDVPVLYLDAENSQSLVRDRLLEMGATAESLRHLHYASFPAIGALDTERGAEELLALARDVDAQLIVLDTVSRFVNGGENDSDTWLQLYRLTLAPLKREGRTIVRIDHTGKDVSLGARGSSAKQGDADVGWIMQKGATPARLKMVCEFDRTPHHGAPGEAVHLVRRQSPLRHEIVTGKVTLSDLADDEFEDAMESLDDDVRALIADMDARGVPAKAGREKAQVQYNASGGELRVSNEKLSQAIRFRKARNAQNIRSP